MNHYGTDIGKAESPSLIYSSKIKISLELFQVIPNDSHSGSYAYLTFTYFYMNNIYETFP